MVVLLALLLVGVPVLVMFFFSDDVFIRVDALIIGVHDIHASCVEHHATYIHFADSVIMLCAKPCIVRLTYQVDEAPNGQYRTY